MVKQLHNYIFLFSFLFTSSISFSQNMVLDNHNDSVSFSLFLTKKDASKNILRKYDFTINLFHGHHHDHIDDISSIRDIISSDKSTDFNCSGGFCMNSLHFHKRGLSLKKQLFEYIISISC